jgi:DNA modification methylase
MVLWSNPGENVFTPFMGVGSEVYGAIKAGRRGIGVELKASYYRQACKNVNGALTERNEEHPELFDTSHEEMIDEVELAGNG